jgi:hypothetical protein
MSKQENGNVIEGGKGKRGKKGKRGPKECWERRWPEWDLNPRPLSKTSRLDARKHLKLAP